MRNVGRLIVILLVTYAVAALGGVFTSASVQTWYPTLVKPNITPPAWVFGPAWTLLYALMGVAAWLVWRRGTARAVGLPLTLYGVQLVLNLAWSAFFFGLRLPALAAGEIVLLWLAILATLICFWRVRPLAGALMAPYLAWVSFAAVLNISIWQLNR